MHWQKNSGGVNIEAVEARASPTFASNCRTRRSTSYQLLRGNLRMFLQTTQILHEINFNILTQLETLNFDIYKNFCTFWRLIFTKLTKCRAPKMAVFALLESQKLISHKIWVIEKPWNKQLNSKFDRFSIECRLKLDQNSNFETWISKLEFRNSNFETRISNHEFWKKFRFYFF